MSCAVNGIISLFMRYLVVGKRYQLFKGTIVLYWNVSERYSLNLLKLEHQSILKTAITSKVFRIYYIYNYRSCITIYNLLRRNFSNKHLQDYLAFAILFTMRHCSLETCSLGPIIYPRCTKILNRIARLKI